MISGYFEHVGRPTEYVLLPLYLTQRFSKVFHGGIPKIIVHIPKNPAYKKEKKYKETAHGDYSNISNYQTKIHAIFRCIFIIFFSVFLKERRIYSTISLGTPNSFLWNPEVPRNCV